MSQSTHNDIELYPLYQILDGLSVYLFSHKAFKHYPLYRTLEGLSAGVSTHTQSYQSLSSLPNTGRSKCSVSTHTQSYQSLSSLPNNYRSKYEFINTQIYQTLYSLPSNGISNRQVTRVYIIQLTIFESKVQIKIKLTDNLVRWF